LAHLASRHMLKGNQYLTFTTTVFGLYILKSSSALVVASKKKTQRLPSAFSKAM